MDKRQLIQNSIISDMSEGVMVIRFDGVIDLVNDAALAILGKERGALQGHSFAHCFFTDPDNDEFTQSVLDAVYDKRRQDRYLPYHAGGATKQLRIVSSFLRSEGEPVGVILVISDITELNELRDAVAAMEKIRALNGQLEIRNRLLKETFGRYLSDDIVREILDSPDGLKLGGQKQTLSIMMSDLRGFTMLCEQMEPQQLIRMLNHYFSVMYEEISRYHGTLIEFMGDGMLVIFGAPIRSETHADDAVAAAISMQRRMAEVNDWNAANGWRALSMGIAINTDEVILGNIGSERRTKYGVLGAPVNLTGRIESYSTEGQILISPSTRAAVRAELSVESEFQAAPKGVRGEITITAVGGIGAPYNLQRETATAPMHALAAPETVQFYALDGKHVSRTPKTGRLLAVSAQEAVLETAERVEVFDNLRLDVGAELYAKATAVEAGRVTLRFTAQPAGFDAWLSRMEQL